MPLVNSYCQLIVAGNSCHFFIAVITLLLQSLCWGWLCFCHCQPVTAGCFSLLLQIFVAAIWSLSHSCHGLLLLLYQLWLVVPMAAASCLFLLDFYLCYGCCTVVEGNAASIAAIHCLFIATFIIYLVFCCCGHHHCYIWSCWWVSCEIIMLIPALILVWLFQGNQWGLAALTSYCSHHWVNLGQVKGHDVFKNTYSLTASCEEKILGLFLA